MESPQKESPFQESPHPTPPRERPCSEYGVGVCYQLTLARRVSRSRQRDGERRWTNSLRLVEQGRDRYRQIPVEVTDRTLTDGERLRVWIYIHRQRKEWDAREKEMVAYRLVDLIGRASAANILGISIRELEKLVEAYELSSRFKGLRDPAGAITWARELMGVSKKLLTPTVVEAVIETVAAKRITIRKISGSSVKSCPTPWHGSIFCQSGGTSIQR
jgi:ParB family chromosome partitioning protein